MVSIIDGNQLIKSSKRFRMFIEGEKGTGKTDFALSWLTNAYNQMKISPDKLLFCILDWDADGISPLLERGRVPDEIISRIKYIPVFNSTDMKEGWKLFKELMKKHIESGGFTPAILVENVGRWWERIQTDYTETVYGKSLSEKMMDAQEKAKMMGKRTMPTLDQMTDWGTIKKLHNEIRDEIVYSPYVVFFTTHLETKTVEEDSQKGATKKVLMPAGQKSNINFFDFVVRKYKKEDGYYARARYMRYLSQPLGDVIKDPDFTKFMNNIYDIMEREANKKPDRFWTTEYKGGNSND